MPFALRTVEPSRYDIAPGSLASDDHTLVNVEITNKLVVTVLQQLKCLVRHADDVFCDLTEECHKVVERTDKIQNKVKSLTVAVENLNYRDVPIPVGDLKVFCQQENGIDHFAARHGYDCLLFAADTRPQSLKDNYNMAMLNPVQIIRKCDEYRRDGVKGSMLFRQWPVFVKQPKSKTPDLSIRRLPLVVSFEKDYKPLKLRNIVIQRSDSGEKEEEEDTKLDTAVIPIDTSGVAFQRMCSFRQSLRSVEEVEGEVADKSLKKKRRQTFSGVPHNVWKEICAFENSKLGENKRNSIQDKLKSYSFDDLDSAPSGTAEEGELIRYLNAVEDRIEEREELEHSLQENKFLRLIPCRRSCSLPRSAKLHANRTKHLQSRPLSKCEAKSETTLATLKGSVTALANKRCSSIGSTLSLHSGGSVASSRQSRSSKRSSIVGVQRIKSMLKGGPKAQKDQARPKSLDLDTLDTEPEEEPPTASNLSRTPSMPEGMHRNVGPGSFYSFESNTLPKMLAKKYDFPWESLPKDWTTSVKLREISKRRIREERNSSSGNWSGSSARHSLESERAKSLGALSQRSVGTDSGRESPTPTAEDGTATDTAGEAGDEGSMVTGETGKSFVDGRAKSRLDTEAWLRSLSIRAAARADSSSSSETIASLTKQNVASMEDFTGDILERYRLMDDDASSVYSLDQEGFYTSFHNDSGLRRSTTTLWEEEEATSPVDGKSCSVHSVSSNLSVDSVIYNPILKTVPSPVIMRPPPKRQVSSSGDSDGSAIFNLPAPTPQPSLNPTVDFSFSESDQELIYARVKQKTRISTTMYPSLCDVSSSDSEGEGSRTKTIGTDRLHQQKPMFDPECVEVVELSSGLKSSLGAVKGNDLHNGLDNRGNQTSKVLSTFSSSGSNDSSTFETTSKAARQVDTGPTMVQNASESNLDRSKGSSSQSFSSVSSLERRPLAAIGQPRLKHSGSLDDSNLLGSSTEDTPCKKQVFNSLPRHYHVYKRNSLGPEYTNSWPRSHQSADHLSTMPQPATGILKSTNKSASVTKTPKTLNFAPVVNMFDPGTPEAVQVLLTSSGESPVREVNRSKLPQTNSFTAPADNTGKAAVKLENARPISSESETDVANDGELPAKYRPTLVVRPGKRPSDRYSDVNPYATSPLTKTNVRKSTGSCARGNETGDLGMYRKSLVTSPTVDSGIGSVGDLSPSTPTSSIGAEEDFEQEDSSQKIKSPGQDNVFGNNMTQQKAQCKTNNHPASVTYSSVGADGQKHSFGLGLLVNGEDLEFADDSDGTQDTPVRQISQEAPEPPSLSSSNDSLANSRSSYSDSKLMDRYQRNKAASLSCNSSSSLPSRKSLQSLATRTSTANTTVSPSTRTSSYRNACADTSRSSSYRIAQSTNNNNYTSFGSKLVQHNPAPTIRSDSYRVACEDLVPPAIPEHQNILEAPRNSVDMTDSAARAESYRVAIEEMEDPEIFEYKPVNKRAAITSLDQLLPKPTGNGSKGLKSPKQIKRSITESAFFSRLRGKQEKSSSKLSSSSSGPLKSSYTPLGLSEKQDSSSKLKTPSSSYRVKPKSSTYVSFDVLSSVEEVKEDSMHGSVESVRAPSISSIQSFQSGQSSNSFLKRDNSLDHSDQQPLVRRSQRHPPGKGPGQIIRPGDNRRRSTGSTGSARVVGGPHVTNGYSHLLQDPSMETGV